MTFNTYEDLHKEAQKAWDSLTYKQKLLVTHHIFNNLHDHMLEGGTFRYLIYDRLGFGMDAYGILIDGLVISNAFHDARWVALHDARLARELPANE
jgi:hypothetical protein